MATTTGPLAMQRSDTAICPFCGKVNPGIRRVPAFESKAGVTVIYSCSKCLRILGIETIATLDNAPLITGEAETKPI